MLNNIVMLIFIICFRSAFQYISQCFPVFNLSVSDNGYMTLGAQHGPMVVVVEEEAWLVHCILLTTEAGAGDSWGGPALDCVPRGGQLRLGVTRHHKLVVRRVSAPGAGGSS